MADERKSILLRIPPELWEDISRLAQRELRSTNAQIEFLLREALRGRGVKAASDTAPAPDEALPPSLPPDATET